MGQLKSTILVYMVILLTRKICESSGYLTRIVCSCRSSVGLFILKLVPPLRDVPLVPPLWDVSLVPPLRDVPLVPPLQDVSLDPPTKK